MLMRCLLRDMSVPKKTVYKNDNSFTPTTSLYPEIFFPQSFSVIVVEAKAKKKKEVKGKKGACPLKNTLVSKNQILWC